MLLSAIIADTAEVEKNLSALQKFLNSISLTKWVTAAVLLAVCLLVTKLILKGQDKILGRSKLDKSLHGLTRTLLNNMITGVHEVYKKELEINGVGYRAAKEGSNLVMNLGYSHQVIVPEIEGISIEVPSANRIVISGCDKQMVGQFAAEVREKRPPEPYKGKGIKYVDEVIRRKVGKTGAKK